MKKSFFTLFLLIMTSASFAATDPNLMLHPRDTRADETTLLIRSKDQKKEQLTMKKKFREAERKAAKKKQVS